jgi:hypothetical protein
MLLLQNIICKMYKPMNTQPHMIFIINLLHLKFVMYYLIIIYLILPLQYEIQTNFKKNKDCLICQSYRIMFWYL